MWWWCNDLEVLRLIFRHRASSNVTMMYGMSHCVSYAAWKDSEIMCEKSISCLILVLVYVSLGNTVFADDCHEHCIHCHAATCKLCRHNLYLHNGTCVHMCPSGYKETVQNVYGNDDRRRGQKRTQTMATHRIMGEMSHILHLQRKLQWSSHLVLSRCRFRNIL